MAKRPSQRQYRWIHSPFSSTYDELPFTFAPGERVPEDYFLYWSSYAELSGWFASWLRQDPKLLQKLRRSSTADVKHKLLDLLRKDAAFAQAPSTTKESLEVAIAGLPVAALHQIIEDLSAAPYTIPAVVPLWTFPEARAMMFAIANRPCVEKSESGWEVQNSDQVELVWRSPPDGDWKVLYRPSTLLNAKSADECKSHLNTHRLKAVLCFQIVLNAAITEGEVTLSLSELVRVLSFSVQTAQDQIQALRTVWLWLQNLDSMIVVGKRRKKYRGNTIRIDDPLIEIVGGTQRRARTDHDEPPTAVTIRPSHWLSSHSRDRGVLQYFGDIRWLTDLSGGQPSTAWALSIGLGLQQHWRENASSYKIGRTGDGGKKTVKTGTISRSKLFDLFPPDIPVEDILFGHHPEKATRYWTRAIALLRPPNRRLIGNCKELERGSYLSRRQGWQSDWLSVPLEIRPASELALSLAAIPKTRRATAPRTPKRVSPSK